MIPENKKIAVVYLAWLPYGIGHFKSFTESYLQFDSGYEHELIIAFNGTEIKHEQPPEHYLDYFRSHSSRPFKTLYFPKGQDIEIYAEITRQIDHDFVFFLNTFSVILKENWLKKYVENWNDHTGVIAASASWQSYYSSVFALNSVKKKPTESLRIYFRKIKLMIKAFIYWRFLFDPFPNPHIRTNAFFMERKVFLQIASHFRIRNKFNAYQFENGKKGLTPTLKKMGKQTKVVNGDGAAFEISEWPLSKTFRIGEQEKLMISDNQTREYQHANGVERELLSKLSWGNHA